MGKSLSSDSARARSQKKKSVETCSAGRAGAHPAPAALSFPRCIPTIFF